MADWWIDDSLPVGPLSWPEPTVLPPQVFSPGGLTPVASGTELEHISYPMGGKPADSIAGVGARVWVTPGGYVNAQGYGNPAVVVKNVGQTISVRYV